MQFGGWERQMLCRTSIPRNVLGIWHDHDISILLKSSGDTVAFTWRQTGG